MPLKPHPTDPDKMVYVKREYNFTQEQDTVQRLSALVRAQQITIDKLEAQRTWVGLTPTQVKLLWEGVPEEAIKSGDSVNWIFYTHINEALKERNT